MKPNMFANDFLNFICLSFQQSTSIARFLLLLYFDWDEREESWKSLKIVLTALASTFVVLFLILVAHNSQLWFEAIEEVKLNFQLPLKILSTSAVSMSI